jgi:hypothetical protein
MIANIVRESSWILPDYLVQNVAKLESVHSIAHKQTGGANDPGARYAIDAWVEALDILMG